MQHFSMGLKDKKKCSIYILSQNCFISVNIRDSQDNDRMNCIQNTVNSGINFVKFALVNNRSMQIRH